MPLLGNYNVLAKLPLRRFSGTTISGDRSNWNRGGANRNRFFNDGNQDSTLASSPENNSVPSGYLPPYCWIMAQSDPSSASRNNIEGESTLGADLTVAQAMTVSLSGSSTISPSADKIAPVTSDLSGSSTLTASVAVPVGAAADLSGSSAVSASLEGRVSMTGDLTGSSTVSATSTQLVSLAADFSSTGTVLDTSNVAAAVLAGVIEAGYTLKDVLRLLAAEAVGEVTGGPDNPEFVGLDETTVRVTATVDPDGNRSSMVLTPG